VAACAAFAGPLAAQNVEMGPRHVALADAERDVVARSNDLRRAQGLPPTLPDAALSASARAFADYMARTDRYDHDADGREPAERARASGYQACRVSENIAYQFSSAGFGSAALARGFIEGWIDSPGHRRNLLDPAATDTGVAVARSARSGRYYAVQMFGRPETLSVRFALSNGSAATVHYAVDGQHHALTRGATRWHRHSLPPTVNLTLPGKATPLALRPADGAHYRIGAAGQALHMIGNGARPAVPRRSRNPGVHGVAADR